MGEPSSEVQTYLERVRMLVAEKPWLLWAHAYTQHMGILAGGQVLRKSVRGTLQIIDDEPGTACFELKVCQSRRKDAPPVFPCSSNHLITWWPDAFPGIRSGLLGLCLRDSCS